MTLLRKNQIPTLISLLNKEYTNLKPSLNFRSAFELLVAVILSAQCTDERVNKVTAKLFPKKRPLTPKDILKMGKEDLRKAIFSTSYFNSKTKAIYGCAEQIEILGKVPEKHTELIKLPGVGTKTAQVIESQWFKKPAFPVDTHVHRLSNRIGLSNSGTSREKTEKQVKALVPQKYWNRLHLAFIAHGRKTCTARNPKCGACMLFKICKWNKKTLFASNVLSPLKVVSNSKTNQNKRP